MFTLSVQQESLTFQAVVIGLTDLQTTCPANGWESGQAGTSQAEPFPDCAVQNQSVLKSSCEFSRQGHLAVHIHGKARAAASGA